MRQWVPKDHLVHLIMDAVEELDLRAARVNQRGTGEEQYPPAMMLGLLVYCYASGVFSSRVIEGMTYENVAVRVLWADTTLTTTRFARSGATTGSCWPRASHRYWRWQSVAGC